MKILFWAAGLLVVFVLQTKISVFGISPDLTAAAAYYIGISGGAVKGIFLGSFIGIIEDSLVGGMLGPNLLGKGMIGFFSSFMSGSLFRWTPLFGMLAIFTLTIADGVCVYLSRSIFEAPPAPFSAAALTILSQGLMNLVIGIFIKPENVE